MKEVYILATEQTDPIPLEDLRGTFESDDVAFEPAEGDEWSFLVRSEDSQVQVRFESLEASIGWTPELLTGSEASHQAMRAARGFYRVSFELGKPQPSVAVFEALWAARAILERVPGVLLDVTAFKLHEPNDVVEITELEFDIRDHVNLHAVEATEGDAPLWVHSHGMEKFATRDVEMFRLAEKDLLAAESFLHELCTDLAFGQGPGAHTLVETSSGHSFTLAASEEARGNLLGLPLETFEGHDGLFFTVCSPEGRHNASELLRPYRQRFDKEPEEKAQAHLAQAQALLPAFKARFQRKGLMEPLTFLVRSVFETHPSEETVQEDLWVELLAWEEGKVVGKLVDGAQQTTEWRKGAPVELEEGQINAIAVGREGQALDEDELRSFLLAERPM